MLRKCFQRKRIFPRIIKYVVSFLLFMFIISPIYLQVGYLKIPYPQKIRPNYPINHSIISNIIYDGNEKCNIVRLNEWDPSIKFLLNKGRIRHNNKYRCFVTSKNNPLSYIDAKNFLHIDQQVNRTFFESKIDSCQYSYIFRNTSVNDNYNLGEYAELRAPFFVENEFIKVRCFLNNSNNKSRSFGKLVRRILPPKRKQKLEYIENGARLVIYEYVHFVALEKILKRSLSEVENVNSMNKAKMNVMILIFDGVSLSSMKRALPNTLEYLKRFDEFVLFENHHIVGENTIQNLMPMLANMESDEVISSLSSVDSMVAKNLSNSSLDVKEPFDKIPFIWKDFKKR
jgi:hypothetical protein